MEIKELLKSKKWTMWGAWKEPMILSDAVSRGIMDKSLTRLIPYSLAAYPIINFGQYSAKDECRTNFDLVKDIINRQGADILEQFREKVEQVVKETEDFYVDEFNADSVKKFVRQINKHAVNWFEVELFDGALQDLYPASLPARFKLAGQDMSREELFAETALPKKMFPIIEERFNILKIASDLKKGQDVRKDLEKHARKFGWTNSLCWWDDPFDFEYYFKEASQLAKGDPNSEWRKMKQDRDKQYQHAENLLASLKKEYSQAWLYLDMIRELADLKEANWDAVSIAGVTMRPALKKLAAQYNLSYNQILMMNIDELLLVLSKQQNPDVTELNRRLKKFAIIHTENNWQAFSGIDVEELLKLVSKEVPKVDELKGTVIWQGKVEGRVKLINSVSEVGRMEQGEILVCKMTDPDLLPAIHKAQAIVTDQGGLLCHAAIVAREFRIPCIVGTEFATKIFKDGDMVEVDANKGIVKKI